MFGEMLLLGVVALLCFGSDRMPEMGRAAGEIVLAFQNLTKGLKQDIRNHLDDSKKSPAEPVPARSGPGAPMPAQLAAPAEEQNPPESLSAAELVESPEVAAEAELPVTQAAVDAVEPVGDAAVHPVRESHPMLGSFPVTEEDLAAAARFRSKTPG